MPAARKTNRLDLNGCSCTGWVLARAGRYLLLTSALSLLTMPITEHLWTWDRFLQTGRDFELCTLMLLIFLCLTLVLSRQCKQCVESLLSMCHGLAFEFGGGSRPMIWAQVGISRVEAEFLAEPRTGMRDFPLQI